MQHFQPGVDSLFGGSDANVARSRHRRVPKESAELPPEHDLVYARAAASAVLSQGIKGASQPWENPATGARGR